MNSASHKANILGDYTHVGIGTVESDGRLYVTEIFVKLPATSTTSKCSTLRPCRKAWSMRSIRGIHHRGAQVRRTEPAAALAGRNAASGEQGGDVEDVFGEPCHQSRRNSECLSMVPRSLQPVSQP